MIFTSLFYKKNTLIVITSVHIGRTLLRYVSTTTTVITQTDENTASKASNSPSTTVVNSPTSIITTPVVVPEVSSNDTLLKRIEENNAALNSIRNRQSTSIEEVKEKLTDSSIGENPISNQYGDVDRPTMSESNVKSIVNDMQYPNNTQNDLPHPTEEIKSAVSAVIASSNLIGQALAEKMKSSKILLTESEQAEQRQQALHHRITEFFQSFGITRGVMKLGLGIAVAYTVYNLIRYRQLPFGGFLKGLFNLFFPGGNTSGAMTSSMTGPTNNITITLPSNALPDVKNIPSPTASSINNFVDSLSPTTWAVITGALFLILKFKR